MTSIDMGRPIPVPDAKKQAFKALTSIPEYSWPALVLSVVVITTVVVVDALALMGYVNYALACLLLSFAYYWFFSIMHDAVHRSVSKNKKLNDFCGQLGSSTFAPYASLHLFRWAHMEHHRFTNDKEGDPDIWVHGSWWSMPLRWMTIDLYYAYRLLKNDSPQAKKVLKESMPYMIFGFALIAILIAAGYGFEYLVLWFIPSRLAFCGIGYSFFWLPHAHWPNPEHELRQSKNYTLASTVRLGQEWLLNPLLQYQNYHLIHHLWPSTPFYNNERVWKLLEPELRERDLAIAHNLAVLPELVYTSSHNIASSRSS